MSNTDGDMIAAKFLQHCISGTGRVKIDRNGENLDCARLVTDGESIYSYEWWLVAYWIDGATIAVTTDDFTYPVTRRRWKGSTSYTVERLQKSPTTAHHVDSARHAVMAAGFQEVPGLTQDTYFEYGDGKRHFQVYRDPSRNPADFTRSEKRNRHDAELTVVSFPRLQDVNGLTIRGWYLLENGGEMFPAFYCGEFDALRGGYRGKNYNAVPLYAIESDGSEVCDTCLCPLNEFAYAEYQERETEYLEIRAEARANPGGYMLECR